MSETPDTNPTALEDGFYYFDLTQAETNGDMILIAPVSSTGDIQVIGCPAVIFTNTLGVPVSLDSGNATLAGMLTKMQLEGRHTLVVLPMDADNIFMSLRNIKGVRVTRQTDINTYSILWADNIVFTKSSLSGVEEVFGS